MGQYARFEEFEQGFDSSEFTSIGPNNQFEQPRIISSRMNDDDGLASYPTITSDQPDPF